MAASATTLLVGAADPDDQISEARSLGAISTTRTVSDSVSAADDVDMYSFSAVAGQRIGFDIDTPTNGVPGLGSYLRIFDATGRQLTFNNDGAAPGEPTVGFDAYAAYTFGSSAVYYVGVSNYLNTGYGPIGGSGDTIGNAHLTGSYALTLNSIDSDDQIAEARPIQLYQSIADTILSPTDVDMFKITVAPNQRVAIDVDRSSGSLLDSHLRLFSYNASTNISTEIGTNNNAAAPGETLGKDSYLDRTFLSAGTYYIGVSASPNTAYGPVSGNDGVGGTTGGYTLTVSAFRLAGQFVRPDPGSPTTWGWNVERWGGGLIDPTKRTWLVTHGFRNSRLDMIGLVGALAAQNPSDQVLTLDWSGAALNGLSVGEAGASIGLVEGGIENLARSVAPVLNSVALRGSRLNLVGHSFGANVSGELSERLVGGVDTITVLDPAKDVPSIAAGGGTYNSDTSLNFSTYSRNAWAFYASSQGNQISSATADAAIVVKSSSHGGVVSVYTALLRRTNVVSTVFSTSRLLAGPSAVPWRNNQFNENGSFAPGRPFDAVLTATASGTLPLTVEYRRWSDGGSQII